MKSNYSELVAIHVMFRRCMHALFRQCYQWYKEGTIPSLPIESKLWRKGRFETTRLKPKYEKNVQSVCAL